MNYSLQTASKEKQEIQLFKHQHSNRSQNGIFLKNVHEILVKNIGNEDFDTHIFAQKMHLSISQLNRRLNNLLDCPSGKLIRRSRLLYAACLLNEQIASIGEIAFEAGFKSQGSFSRSFRQEFGCSPSDFLKENHNASKR